MRATREPRSNPGGFMLVVSSLVVLVVHVSGAMVAQTGPVTGSVGLPHFDRALLLESTSETSANVSIGDLNGDGNLDIVLAKGRHWPLVDRVLLNDGHGRFPVAHNLGEAADRTYSASLADLDGDGDLDVVIGNDAPDPKRVYLNDGKGNFRPGSTYGRPDWPMRNGSVADLNGDGLPDIIVANRTGDNSGANYICLNRGKGVFDADCLAFSHESATTITPADFNHDRFVDLAVPHREGGQSHVYLNDGKAGFPRQVPFGPPDAAIRMTAAADLDRDGLVDIVAIDERRGGFIYFNQKDGTFSPGAPRKVDIIVGNVDAPSTIYFNDGSGRHFTAAQVGDNKGTVYGFAVGDLDTDGLPDLAVARSDAPNVVYFGASSEPRSARPALFVELKYAPPGLFSGQQYDVDILWSGFSFTAGQVELLRDDRVVRQYKLPPPAAPGAAMRDGVRRWRMGMGMTVDVDLPAGTYRVRARIDEWVSEPSQSFVIEPWGVAVDGIQIGLSADRGGYSVRAPVPVTVSMRNAGDRALCVPIPIVDEEFARTSWELYQPNGSALFDARPAPSREVMGGRFLVLQPGESRTAQFDLHRLQSSRADRTRFGDRAGTYLVGASVFMFNRDVPCATAWNGRATSNVVQIDVKPRQARLRLAR